MGNKYAKNWCRMEMTNSVTGILVGAIVYLSGTEMTESVVIILIGMVGYLIGIWMGHFIISLIEKWRR